MQYNMEYNTRRNATPGELTPPRKLGIARLLLGRPSVNLPGFLRIVVSLSRDEHRETMRSLLCSPKLYKLGEHYLKMKKIMQIAMITTLRVELQPEK